jgi:hypothetical protein
MFVATLLTGVAFAIACGPCAADGASPLARFGLLEPVAREPAMQPLLDRYAIAAGLRIADAAAISLVPIPRSDGPSLATAATCRRLHLSGFVEPHRRWRVADDTAFVRARVSLVDCNGNVYYSGNFARRDARDAGLAPQEQIDNLQVQAIELFAQDFAAYKRAHEPAWDLMVRGGPAATPLQPYRARAGGAVRPPPR